MGWTFIPNMTRLNVIDEATGSWENQDGRKCELLKRVEVGDVVYSVHRLSGDGPERILAAVTLLSWAEGSWGYKAMDETCGPAYHDFPVEWLDELSPPATKFSERWRERVRAQHKE